MEYKQLSMEIKKLIEDGFVNMLILGNVGVGKTHLVQRVFPDAFFMEESEFRQHITAGTAVRLPVGIDASLPMLKKYPLEGLSRHPIVIYDDIGISELTSTYIEKMLYWQNQREKVITGQKKQTVYTTNLTLEELQEREARIYSRIMNKCHVFILDGEDRRLQTSIYHT